MTPRLRGTQEDGPRRTKNPPQVRGGLLGAEGPAPDATCPAVVAGALTAAPAATLGPTMPAGAIKGSAPVTLEVKVDSCDGVAPVSSNPSKSTVSTPDASTTDASSGQKNQPLPLCLLRQQSYREPVPVTAFVLATNPPEAGGHSSNVRLHRELAGFESKRGHQPGYG